MSTVIRVKGIYNGETVELLESISIPPNTEVDVLFQKPNGDSEERERLFIQELIEQGLITEVSPQQVDPTPYQPIHVEGECISATIIKERR